MKQTIPVTGGTGYIGSHASVELLAAGHEVVIFDKLSNSCRSVQERIARIAGRGVIRWAYPTTRFAAQSSMNG